MCPPIIGVVLGIVGSLAQAAMTTAIAKQQSAIEQQQLKAEIEVEQIGAMQRTNDRLEELRRNTASNRAAMSIVGGTNLSYQQGIEPYNKKVAGRDVDRDNYNTGQVVGRKKYEIAVSGWKAKATSRSAFVEAGANAASSIGSLWT